MSAICAQAPSVHNAPTSTKREPDFVAICFAAAVLDLVFMCSNQGFGAKGAEGDPQPQMFNQRMATCSMAWPRHTLS